MKHKLIVFLVLCVGVAVNTAAQDLLVIDAGHGGPGADQTHNGGNGTGTVGPSQVFFNSNSDSSYSWIVSKPSFS